MQKQKKTSDGAYSIYTVKKDPSDSSLFNSNEKDDLYLTILYNYLTTNNRYYNEANDDFVYVYEIKKVVRTDQSFRIYVDNLRSNDHVDVIADFRKEVNKFRLPSFRYELYINDLNLYFDDSADYIENYDDEFFDESLFN